MTHSIGINVDTIVIDSRVNIVCEELSSPSQSPGPSLNLTFIYFQPYKQVFSHISPKICVTTGHQLLSGLSVRRVAVSKLSSYMNDVSFTYQLLFLLLQLPPADLNTPARNLASHLSQDQHEYGGPGFQPLSRLFTRNDVDRMLNKTERR